MINRIIDSFVLNSDLLDKDIEHQFDIFQNGKIRITIHKYKEWEHRWGDYDQYETYSFSHIDYLWYDNIDDLVSNMGNNNALILNSIFNNFTWYMKYNKLKFNELCNEINKLTEQIKEHYNQLFYKNHILD